MQDHYSLAHIQAILHKSGLDAQLAGLSSLHSEPILHYSFDSRTIGTNAQSTCFLALAGKRDGHGFIPAARQQGVLHYLLSKPEALPVGAAGLVVNNVLKALQVLAAHHRSTFVGSVIGITGSNGKTIVKEWLSELIGNDIDTYTSPGSFNSQLGVPLAVLGIRAHHQLAIVEVGISQKGEMELLEAIVKPTVGVLTHFGDAHNAGFSSLSEKFSEKLLLFKGSDYIIALEQKTLDEHGDLLQHLTLKSVRYTYTVPSMVGQPVALSSFSDVNATFPAGELQLSIPFKDTASIENAVLATAVALSLGLPKELVGSRLKVLRPIRMRSEIITDNPDVTVINDAYSADKESLSNALALLRQNASQPRKHLIIAEFEHQSGDSESFHRELALELTAEFGPEHCTFIGTSFGTLPLPNLAAAYPNVESFLQAFDYTHFERSTVLLKGARKHALERIIPFLTRHSGHSVLEIDVAAFLRNIAAFRGYVPDKAVILMLKASAYGSGAWQLAQHLTTEHVAYLAVAHPKEGIELRERGIELPIMVQMPGLGEWQLLGRYQLEPILWSAPLLSDYLEWSARSGSHLPLHIEFDTGMTRLGFNLSEAEQVITALEASKQEPASLMSHLASSEDPGADAYTEQQLQHFAGLQSMFKAAFPAVKTHILNTAGAIRFPDFSSDFIRLGLGSYGLASTVSDGQPLDLEEAVTLKTKVIQVRLVPKGTPVGYNQKSITKQETVIATVAIGYADGLNRNLGLGRYSVLIHGQLAPIIGNVSMDMIMVDATNVGTVQAGDEVVVFGQQGDAFLSVHAFASAAGVIPYQVPTAIPNRVRRVYLLSR